jgi:hypothetical protein
MKIWRLSGDDSAPLAPPPDQACVSCSKPATNTRATISLGVEVLFSVLTERRDIRGRPDRMFSFFGAASQDQGGANLFSENDIKAVLGSFHISDSDHSRNLVLSASKGDLIKREELLSAIEREVTQGEAEITVLRTYAED